MKRNLRALGKLMGVLSMVASFAAFASDHHVASDHHQAPSHNGVFQDLLQIFDEFKEKVAHLQRLDEGYEELLKKTAVLETENAKLKFSLRAGCEEKERAAQIKQNSLEEGGFEGARTLASLPESNEFLSKPPRVVYQSSLKAFKEGDFEASAQGFALLSDNPENDSFKTAQVYFLGGISLYRLKNFKLAQKYFQKALSRAHQGKKGKDLDDISYAPRALAWLALCAEKLGDTKGKKQAVFELIQKYPKSKEARRLNRHA